MNAKLIDIVTADVCKLLGRSEEDMFDLKSEVGINYLEARFKDDPNIGKLLSEHANFWTWWRSLWAQRDRWLLQHCQRKRGDLYVRYNKDEVHILHGSEWDFYKEYHQADKIPFYPNHTLINSCAIREKRHTQMKGL